MSNYKLITEKLIAKKEEVSRRNLILGTIQDNALGDSVKSQETTIISVYMTASEFLTIQFSCF